MILKALFPNLHQHFQLAIRSVDHRADLAGVELAEARDQLLTVLLLILGTAIFLIIAGGMLSVLIVTLTWDTPYRLHAISGLLAIYLIGAGVCLGVMRFRLRQWKPFALTKDQIRQDAHCINTLIESS